MNKDKPILFIVGKSGTGKTTVVEYLRKVYGMQPLDSYTTRPKRSKYEVGHTFISLEEYKQLENIVAETHYLDNYYCATQEQYENSDLYVIDPAGVEFFKAYKKEHPEIKDYKIVVFDAPVWVRAKRMLMRGDKPLKVLKRLINDMYAFVWVYKYADLEIKATQPIEGIAWEIHRFWRWGGSK